MFLLKEKQDHRKKFSFACGSSSGSTSARFNSFRACPKPMVFRPASHLQMKRSRPGTGRAEAKCHCHLVPSCLVGREFRGLCHNSTSTAQVTSTQSFESHVGEGLAQIWNTSPVGFSKKHSRLCIAMPQLETCHSWT